MAMQISSSITGNHANLALGGRFDFNATREFREAYEQILAHKDLEAINVDLANVDYLDSSALGMLLLFKEKAGPGGVKLSLVNSRGGVRQILEVANFHKLFTVS